MDCKNQKPVKVVIIGTQYIETNPLSFKSVVQSLTGKDSCVAWIEESSYKSRKRRRTVDKPSGDAPAELSNCRSFNDWDGLMLELPPAEELSWVWGS
ncbi:hypothetical protein PVL29_013274 [Vitis rotundifolia]|uniref:VQ domain-containing protein n=1 Tax=Vitis rotundifolia TaxID=103349 RepID=A0AA38ZL01_VITRO|nr:hypothetical protein PVL29_013274 [Vitis rotundifolia]